MPETASFRRRVLTALTDALKEISPAGGWVHDLSAAVFRGRLAYDSGAPLPMVSILEHVEPPDGVPVPEGGVEQANSWNLLVQGFVADDPENPTDPAYDLEAEVRKRLAAECRQVHEDDGILGFRGLVTNLRIAPPIVRPADDVSAKAYFWMNVTLDLVEDLENPFA